MTSQNRPGAAPEEAEIRAVLDEISRTLETVPAALEQAGDGVRKGEAAALRDAVRRLEVMRQAANGDLRAEVRAIQEVKRRLERLLAGVPRG